jgi:hypothetical protein
MFSFLCPLFSLRAHLEWETSQMIREIHHAGCGATAHIHRRAALKSMAMAGVAALALAPLASMASAFTGETTTQEGWRRCRKCHVLFFALDETLRLGVCADGGSHVPSRPFYLMRRGRERAGVQQGGWSWCMRCTSLYARHGAGLGVCPAGDERNPGHDNYSGAYVAVFEDEADKNRQGGWRWCSKCFAMFDAEDGNGECPDGGEHDGSISLRYAQLIDRNG